MRSLFDTTPEPPDDSRLEPEYRDLYAMWKQKPGPVTVGPLMRALKPELERATKPYGGTALGHAKQITLKALESYDPQQASLRTHLSRQLLGLKRITARQQQAIPMPERVALDRRQLHESMQSLEHELGREPSLQELADRTGLSVKRIQHVRGFSPGISEGQIAGDSGFSPLVQRESNAYLELVYADLEPTDQKVFEWSLGWQGQPQLSTTEIARRLNRTPGAISQRKKRIQALLDEMQDLAPLG